LVFAQLRDMLTAEDSAIVPEKNHHRGRFRPQRSKQDLFVIGIGQANASQSRAE
jgi:hypothetical protein